MLSIVDVTILCALKIRSLIKQQVPFVERLNESFRFAKISILPKKNTAAPWSINKIIPISIALDQLRCI